MYAFPLVTRELYTYQESAAASASVANAGQL